MMESFRNNGEEKDFLQFLKNIVCDIKLKPYVCVVNDINGMGGRHNKTCRAGREAVGEWHEEERQNESGKMRAVG
jgi:hypothetical protein